MGILGVFGAAARAWSPAILTGHSRDSEAAHLEAAERQGRQIVQS